MTRFLPAVLCLYLVGWSAHATIYFGIINDRYPITDVKPLADGFSLDETIGYSPIQRLKNEIAKRNGAEDPTPIFAKADRTWSASGLDGSFHFDGNGANAEESLKAALSQAHLETVNLNIELSGVFLSEKETFVTPNRADQVLVEIRSRQGEVLVEWDVARQMTLRDLDQQTLGIRIVDRHAKDPLEIANHLLSIAEALPEDESVLNLVFIAKDDNRTEVIRFPSAAFLEHLLGSGASGEDVRFCALLLEKSSG